MTGVQTCALPISILFGCFILYSFYLYQDERKFYNKDANQIQDEDVAAGVPTNGKEVVRDILIAILMLLLTIAGASVVLQLIERIVNETGIAGSLIGVVTLGLASNNTVARIFHCQSAPFGIRGLSGFYPLSFRFPPFRLPAGLQEHMRNPVVIAFMHGARSKSAKEYS